MLIKGLKPVVSKSTEVMVLGTIPGNLSLEKKQYYAYEKNHFWRILFSAIKESDPKIYDKRIKALLRNRIGIWNVFESCYREGSCDRRIKKPKINELNQFFHFYPKIKKILLNGRMAYDRFKTYYDESLNICYEYLPSTSSRNTQKISYITNKWYKAFRTPKIIC
ncbi:MAG: DNA-deoxyinosine glycosylase [Elusimicrobia bacterium]|nr:DNA-deoxyinosine glycosylase [Elusimicrobiota bacterium]